MMENVISSFAPLVRILLVDDFEPWRRSVRSLLEPYQQLAVVDEAVDELTAVQKVKELQPDLILLDIALPNLNGIDASGRISQVAQGSKVLFLSQNNDADVVQAAMSNRAKGYVLKADAGRAVLPAVEAVLNRRGRRGICQRTIEGLTSTTPLRNSAACFRAVSKLAQFGWGNSEVRVATIQTDRNLRKYHHGRLIQTLQSGKVNVNFRGKSCADFLIGTICRTFHRSQEIWGNQQS